MSVFLAFVRPLRCSPGVTNFCLGLESYLRKQIASHGLQMSCITRGYFSLSPLPSHFGQHLFCSPMPAWCMPNNSIVIIYDWIPLYCLKRGYFRQYLYSSLRCFLILLTWLVTSKVFHLVCISKATQSDTSKLLRFSRSNHLISYGYPDTSTPVVSDIQPMPPLNSDPKRFRILFFADSQPHKNPNLTIKALELLQLQSYSGKTVSIVVKSYPLYNKMMALCPHADIYLFPPDSRLSLLMRESQYILYPSTIEGFGLPVFEAFHHGSIPIVYPSKVNTELLGMSYPYYADSAGKVLSIINAVHDDCRPSFYGQDCIDRVSMNSLNNVLSTLMHLC